MGYMIAPRETNHAQYATADAVLLGRQNFHYQSRSPQQVAWSCFQISPSNPDALPCTPSTMPGTIHGLP